MSKKYFQTIVWRSPNFFPNRLTFFKDNKASIKQYDLSYDFSFMIPFS